jgi:uncharacterized protein (DUF1501 family)
MTPGGLTRRGLLRASVALQLLAAGPGVLVRAAMAQGRDDESERVLVVVQLTGGNDGLNTIVPFANDAYHRARPVLAVPAATVVRLDDEAGLHPALADLEPLWQEGRLAVLRGAGPPSPDRSHFRSMEMWHTGSTDETPPHAGWLGTAVRGLPAGAPLPAALLGDRNLPLALAGAPSPVPAIPTLKAMDIDAGGPVRSLRHACCETAGREEQAARVAQAYRAAFECSERLQRLGSGGDAVGFPAGDPGTGLRLAAQFIGARLGTRVLYVTQGGYDTHAGQERDHPGLLRALAGALAAFQEQLEAQGDGARVLTVVFSEFGRRVRENASGGTDHGAANPVLLVGRPARGGIHGKAPDLEAGDGDVPVTTDYRRLYATLLDWMGLDAATVMPGTHECLPLLS